MESVRRLDHIGNHTRFQGHCRIRECWPETALCSHSELTSLAGVAQVLRVESCEGAEFLSRHNALTQSEELFFCFHLGLLAVRIDAYLAHLILCRNLREVAHICSIDIGFNVKRGDLRDVLRNLHLLLLGQGHILKLLLPLLTQLIDGFAEIFLHFVISSKAGADCVHPLVEICHNHFLVDGQGVNFGLHQEHLRFEYVLQNVAAHILVGGISVGAHHLHFLFDVGEHYELSAHYRYGLVYQTVVFLCSGCCGYAQAGCCCEYLLHFLINYKITFVGGLL